MRNAITGLKARVVSDMDDDEMRKKLEMLDLEAEEDEDEDEVRFHNECEARMWREGRIL